MKRFLVMLVLFLAAWGFASGSAEAHFGMIIPSDQMVMQDDSKNVRLNLMFWHPFEGHGMDLVRPKAFGVVVNGRKTDLSKQLKLKKINNRTAWETTFQVRRPGLYVFFMEPQPYWEPAEDCFIVHYTKAYVTAIGDDEGWDEPIGLKTEIVPLSKPYGLYTGNVFQGAVMLKGKAVPYAEVEVEYFNQDGRLIAPTDYMITQTIKADKNGVFTYAAPRAGWWGFAALSTDDQKMKHNGQDKDVEIGAVIWVRFHDMK
ncbi:MAG: DUF4198 domain-containing protein [Deltaproteobacteria bacterium]|nr:DUF4198 domain-containing protein [Deltaproteobacteria bacterium]MBW2086312.1 DUF4198 domain-containing protein [Deltaproteobacteria bacterium]